MDIGIVKREDGKLDYYVNEVSRPPCCSLMQHLQTDSMEVDVMAACVKESLVNTYLHHRHKYPELSRRHVI